MNLNACLVFKSINKICLTKKYGKFVISILGCAVEIHKPLSRNAAVKDCQFYNDFISGSMIKKRAT